MMYLLQWFIQNAIVMESVAATKTDCSYNEV